MESTYIQPEITPSEPVNPFAPLLTGGHPMQSHLKTVRRDTAMAILSIFAVDEPGFHALRERIQNPNGNGIDITGIKNSLRILFENGLRLGYPDLPQAKKSILLNLCDATLNGADSDIDKIRELIDGITRAGIKAVEHEFSKARAA